MAKDYNDSYILTLLSEGSEQGLKALSSTYGKLLYSLAYRITGVREDSEEVVSDTLMEIWQNPPQAITVSLMSLVCAVARRKAVDKVRASASEKRRNSRYLQVQNELFSDFDEDSVVDSLTVSRVMNEFLISLTEEEKYIFLRRYYEYAEYSEIARELHIEQSSVRARLSRMRKKLKERLLNENITV